MRIRLAVLILLLLAGGSAPASPFSEAAERLDGEWHSADFVLKVDSRRAQASVDANRPFHWERFLIKEVTEDEIVFSIGAELFQAAVEENMLVLTGTTFRGKRVLFRDPDLRGGTVD
jgi:hypothetical protein